MPTDLTISVPEDPRKAMASAAEAEGKSLDALAIEAMEKHLARRFLERMKREAVARRGNMTDEEVEEVVDRAIHEYRAERAR